ncbi:MAG: AI-2E family transporter [Deltaproteobacteria bacterium]|nr:AI-2E family transporter [Deltaproteobacteria bacterium]MBW2418040.1 AI-2E family transporter [Deltaproteobacteria bacterium]
MPESGPRASDELFLQRAVEATVRIGLLLVLAAWCFSILRPFVIPVAWGAIIAIAIQPAHLWLENALGGRGRTAAVIITIAGLALLIVPALLFAGSLVESGQQVAEVIRGDTFQIPPPPEQVESWPLIGETIYKTWSLANTNLEAALTQFAPQLKAIGTWAFTTGAGTGLMILQFIVSIIIAGVLLVGAATGVQAAKSIAVRLAGPRGEQFAILAGSTIRSVAVGIVGVAIIQTGLIGIGFIGAGVPHAAVLTTLCLFLCVLQLPPLLVVFPVIFYVWSVESTVFAVLFTVWSLLAGGSDNILKPILLGRGLNTPMLVIFLGAIGGFMSSGFIGLFVGAVVLALGYELFMAWLQVERQADEGAA